MSRREETALAWSSEKNISILEALRLYDEEARVSDDSEHYLYPWPWHHFAPGYRPMTEEDRIFRDVGFARRKTDFYFLSTEQRIAKRTQFLFEDLFPGDERDYRKKICCKYGISVDEYDQLLTHQNFVCALCSGTKRFVVDHNHFNGRVRGLLCYRCNTGIGHAYDDEPEALERTYLYLRRAFEQ